MATKKRRKSSKNGGTGGVFGFFFTLFVIGLALAFMRVNGIYDFDSGLAYFRRIGHEGQQVTVSKVDEAIAKSCNFVKDASCLYTGNIQTEIGDLNGDGVVNNTDSDIYANKHGASTIGRPSSGNGGSSGSTGSSGTGQSSSGSTDNGNQSQPVSNEYIAKLNTLAVAEPDGSKYSRSDYKHWVTVSGSCDAREESLKSVGFATNPKTCRAESGAKYTDPYTGKTFTDPTKLDIDHVIPLGYVDQHGGHAWSSDKKQQYANDVQTVLLPVDASSNRQKSDKGPYEWMPSNKTYYCTYAKKWVDIASKYGISVTSRDKQALESALKTCN